MVLTLPVQSSSAQVLGLMYVGNPTHREIAVKALQLALAAGFTDSGITYQEIQERIEAGAYSEDFEPIPGVAGSHYPNPWDQGPIFDFLGFVPITRIPYGSVVDLNRQSGWFRGLPHGYDPVQGFRWPGAGETTLQWANSLNNTFHWGNAIQLYRQGDKAVAYQCLGHVLHLLMDLSVPAHVKVVDHGTTNVRRNSGTPLNPDLADVIVDEYETALGGGLVVLGYTVIPNLLTQFREALDSAEASYIPTFQSWTDYLIQLATYTYGRPRVNEFYTPPSAEGQFGRYLNQSGEIVNPQFYGGAPIGLVDGRVTQFFPHTTANIPGGAILPESVMIAICNDLVPRAVEYCAGLILHFAQIANQVTSVKYSVINPREFSLHQNYPNPFNPSTQIEFQIANSGFVTLKVYNLLGQEVATLVNETLNAGRYEVTFDANKLPRQTAGGLAIGMYFYRLETSNYSDVKKMLLLK